MRKLKFSNLKVDFHDADSIASSQHRIVAATKLHRENKKVAYCIEHETDRMGVELFPIHAIKSHVIFNQIQ